MSSKAKELAKRFHISTKVARKKTKSIKKGKAHNKKMKNLMSSRKGL